MAAIAHEIKGHQDQLRTLIEDLSDHPVGRSYLFCGPEGVGKKKVALALAQFLLCSAHKKPCGVCGSCQRLHKLAHEGLLLIEPQQNLIKIEESRKVLDFLRLKGLSQYRVVIIDEVQFMNPAAANSLLKILEEPPEDVFFFLISSSPNSVLSTIKSRALKILFRPVPIEEIKKDSAYPEWILNSCRGRFSNLMQKLHSEDRQKMKSYAEELKKFLLDSEVLLSPHWRDEFKDKSILSERYQLWLELLRDAIWLKNDHGSDLLHPDLKEVTQSLTQLSQSVLDLGFRKVIVFIKDLSIHRDPVLMSEEFIVEMSRA